MHYDIFISYRRATGKNFARIIKPELEKRGFSVFLDFDELKDGVFDKRIMDAIKDSPIFLLILSEGALDRCANDGDWVKEEILCAKKYEKHIVPVNVDNSFSGIPGELPEDVKAALGAHHYSKIDTESLLEESMEKLVRERISPHVIEAEKKRKAEAVALRKRERQESIRNFYSWLCGHYKLMALAVVVLLAIVLMTFLLPKTVSPTSDSGQNILAGTETDALPAAKTESEVPLNDMVKDSVVNFSIGKAKYTGKVGEDGRPNGMGKAVFVKNGDVFEGVFRYGVLDSGKYVRHIDGKCYKGKFKDDYPVDITLYDE